MGIAQTGAVGGVIAGTLGGAGAGVGTFGAGGTQQLTHYTSPACATMIRNGFNGQGQLGRNAFSNFFATTGKAAFTTVKNTSKGVPVPPASARHFRPGIPTGPITVFGRTAGHQIGPRGVLNLATGRIVVGGSINTAGLGWHGVDGGLSVLSGWIATQAVD